MSQSYRLKASEVAKQRANMLIAQGGKCKLCKLPVNPTEAALDHCHKTGHCRGVLHRGCNAMLGHIENNMPRHKLTSMAKLAAFLQTIPAYINADYSDQPLHHTYRTDEEKRLRRNAKVRKARAKAKE